MTTELVKRPDVQALLDRVAGLDQAGGDARLKPILRDLVEAIFSILDKHDISESEFWGAVKYLTEGAPELGLIVPGIGIEHFLDILLDERDKAAGIAAGGTPRTIEGPLYVAGAPVSEGAATMTDREEDGERLVMHGVVRDLDGNPVPGALVDVWHADTRGFYSHFDPTDQQPPFNFRRRIQTGDDGAYRFNTIMPSGYAVPPDGAADRLMKALGRHGKRPAHIHFFVTAPGFRHLTTQINIADDPLIHDDFAFATRDGLIPEVTRAGGAAEIVFDFALLPEAAGAAYAFSERPRTAA